MFDVLIIGAGPAGYVCAIRAAQNGLKTALVEARKGGALGGTCLNVGCIPSKALLESSEKFHEAAHGLAAHGIDGVKPKLNLAAMMARKDGVVQQLTRGVAGLMAKNKITVINGWATLAGPNQVKVGDETYEAKSIIIATGSTPIELPFAKFDHEVILDSTDALALPAVPKHLVVIGGGVIGLEMGSVWKRLGADVTVVDVAPRPLGVMDGDLGKEAQKIFTKQGLNFKLGAAVKAVNRTRSGAEVELEIDGKAETIKADKVLVAVGRRAATNGLNLAEVGVKTTDRGVIEVNAHYQTSIPSIFAVGDCIPGPMLAHKGEEEGIAVADHLAGKYAHVNYDAIPWVVYTHPEVAGVGRTEEELKAAGIQYKTGKFPFMANGRALAVGESAGFVKILADATTDRVLGVHMIGANTSEMIAEAAMAIEFSASSEDIARTCHAHPTLSEATKEAAMAVAGKAIHF